MCLGSWGNAFAQSKTQTSPAPLTKPAPSNAKSSYTHSVDVSYIISSNDLLEILVFQEPDLFTTTRVSQQGTITLPLIGTIKVGGVSVLTASEMIRKAYQDGYLKNPEVTITIAEFAKKRFHVLGQIQKSGSYEMPQQENVNLLQAISMAGGYTELADSRNITVKRVQNSRESTIRLDAKDMAENEKAAIFEILPNDTITVPEIVKKRFHVLGQVQKPGSFEIPNQENANLLQAIAMAGGYTRIADPGNVTVKRIQEDGKEVTLRLNAKVMAQDKDAEIFLIQHNDTITVGESMF